MFYTKAGKHFSNLMTRWLQDTRLVAEACYRQSAKYDENPDSVTVTHDSWKKRSRVATDGPLTPKDFSLTEPAKGEHIHALLNQMLASQFILLETLWEAYLSELSIELSTTSPELFKDCLGTTYMQDALSDVLTGKTSSLQDVRADVGRRFAACITRKPWSEQWKDLSKLGIGLNAKDLSQSWYSPMDEYFEMRNLIVHARGKVSDRLRKLDSTYASYKVVKIYPCHIDFFRKQFLSCIGYIEIKIKSRFNSDYNH